jgi:hypothetical protein
MSEHRIPPPRQDRPPLKTNILERLQVGNCQLMPLFPYLDEDALVPCGAIFRGAPGAEWGQFFHQNSVDEVIQAFGAEGATLQTGSIYVTQPLHGVNSFLKKPENPDAFLVLIITQRQSAGDEQKEAIVYRCGKCHEIRLKHEYNATPTPRGKVAANAVPTLATLPGLAWLFHAVVATSLWEPLIQFSGLDPIYAGTAIRAAGGVRVIGLAVAGPIGAFLHAMAAMARAPDGS